MLATDIQAVLTVLARRTHTYGKGKEQRLNLAQQTSGEQISGRLSSRGCYLQEPS
jgi:hypothetical protein